MDDTTEQNMNDFEASRRAADNRYDALGRFYKALHLKLRAKGVDAIIDRIPQHSGGTSYRVSVPSKGLETYGALVSRLEGVVFLGNPDFDNQVTVQPNLQDIVDKVSDPRLVNMVGRYVENLIVGTYNDTINLLMEIQSIPGVMCYKVYIPTGRWLQVNYQFIQENPVEDIVGVLERKLIEMGVNPKY